MNALTIHSHGLLAVHAIRIYAIYDRSSAVGIGLGALYAAQVVVTAVCCAFYRSVPLLEGQGCIAGPKGNWVGVYWLLPTLLYTASVSGSSNPNMSHTHASFCSVRSCARKIIQFLAN